MVELKRYKHLVALADERNFARAAERVHLSQSALSRSIQTAEAQLAIQLFDRGTTEVVPTPAGAFVIERARKLLFDSRCLERDVELYRKKQIGELAFGVGPFPAATLVADLIPELRQRFPAVRLRVEVNNWGFLTQNLRQEALDFFVAETRDLVLGPDLDVMLLAKQFGSFYVRAGHPLLARDQLQLTDLIGYGIATVRLPQVIQNALRSLLQLTADAALPIALECDDISLLKRAALASDTVLAISHAVAAPEVAAGQLLLLPLAGLPPMHSALGIVSLRGRSHSPVAAYVIDRLQTQAAQLAALTMP